MCVCFLCDFLFFSKTTHMPTIAIAKLRNVIFFCFFFFVPVLTFYFGCFFFACFCCLESLQHMTCDQKQNNTQKKHCKKKKQKKCVKTAQKKSKKKTKQTQKYVQKQKNKGKYELYLPIYQNMFQFSENKDKTDMSRIPFRILLNGFGNDVDLIPIQRPVSINNENNSVSNNNNNNDTNAKTMTLQNENNNNNTSQSSQQQQQQPELQDTQSLYCNNTTNDSKDITNQNSDINNQTFTLRHLLTPIVPGIIQLYDKCHPNVCFFVCLCVCLYKHTSN